MNIEDKVTLAHIDKINSKRMDTVPRCMILFENSCKSKKTFKTYKMALDYFLEWSNKDYESFFLLSEYDKNKIMQDYVISLRRRCESGEISPNSVSTYLAGVFKFLKVNGCNYNEMSIKQLYPAKMKLAGDSAISTEQIKQILRTCRYKRERALIHFCSATGARPEAITEIQFKHISRYQDGFIKVVLYPLDEHEMVTFLHPEAVSVIDEYLEWRKSKGEKITSESYLFVNTAPNTNGGLANRPLNSIEPSRAGFPMSMLVGMMMAFVLDPPAPPMPSRGGTLAALTIAWHSMHPCASRPLTRRNVPLPCSVGLPPGATNSAGSIGPSP